MKFLRILGVAAAVLMTTAVARQATEVPPAEPVVEAAQPAEPAVEATTPPSVVDARPLTTAADARAATAGDAKAGQTKAGACAACHGVDGNAADPQYPKLAGQHEHYIWRQLRLYKSGERQNPIMQGMAAPLSEQDMRDIGAYFATQKIIAGVADDTRIVEGPNAGTPFYEVGQRIYRAGKPSAGVPACLACHGPAGRGNPGPSWPALGGQHAGYTAAQLEFFRQGGVWGAELNANPTMSQVASGLSDEEVQGLASYLQGLHRAGDTAKAK